MELSKTQYDQVTSPMQSHINVGFGSDITIAELAIAVAKVTNYSGKIIFDSTKPDGPLRKWMSSNRLNQLGWRAQYDLEKGLSKTYTDFCKNLGFFNK
jgi:GDP-L-fucose synthase